MSVSIDDILHPGESRRLKVAQLTAQISTLDQMIHALSALDSPSRHTGLKSALDARHTQSESLGRDDTGAANRLAAPLTQFTLLSTREVISYRVSEQIPSVWCAWDDNDTSGRGGWGSSADEAVLDLLEVLVIGEALS